MAKQDKTPKPRAQAQAQVLATLQQLMGGQDAIKIASAQILKALGEAPSDLLRAKAAQYTEMAELIEACSPTRSEDADAEAEADAAAEVEAADDDEEEDEEEPKPKPKEGSG